MTQHQNDLSLLRPFNLEAAKSCEDICWSNISDEVEFIGVSSTRLIAYESDGELGFICQAALRMKPLCWVENRPVYKGDILYSKPCPDLKYIASFVKGGILYTEDNETQSYCEKPCRLTWNKPKEAKTEGLNAKQKVKRKVWINVYSDGSSYIHNSKESADRNSAFGCIDCVETEIEYEV